MSSVAEKQGQMRMQTDHCTWQMEATDEVNREHGLGGARGEEQGMKRGQEASGPSCL